jgi:membrane protein DedA with SNARE-associated domain
VFLAPASITGPLVDLATHLIRSLGLAGVAVLTASSGLIGAPGSEPTMLLAGFNVFQRHLSLVGIIVAGVVGDMVAATIAYAIGYFGRRELLERQAGKLHLSAGRLDTAHRWFERHGEPVVLVSRVTPFVRAVFPFAAGVAEMRFWRFFVFATLGSVIWISGLGVLGQAVGSNWESWRHHLEYADYVAAAIALVAIAYLLVRRYRSRSRSDPAMDAASR